MSSPDMHGPPPLRWLAWLIAAGLIAYTVAAPLSVARYPMVTDFPFHTACASIFRHYLDPTWTFQQQFTLQLFAVPYLSFYGLAAGLMFFFEPIVATKIATAVFLSLLPVGLMVLCWGMRKSPLLGLWGVVFVWASLAHWGFVNFLAALGLFAMSVGIALRILDKPKVRGQIALTVCLLFIFITHVFRFPFAIAAVLAAGVVMFPATRRWKPLIFPVTVSVSLFAIWWLARPAELGATIEWAAPAWDRFNDAEADMFDMLAGDDDIRLFRQALYVFAGTAGVLLIAALMRIREWPKTRWIAGAHVLVLGCVLVFGALYLTMPMSIGDWWYVYPREITTATFLLPALLPNLPRRTWMHLAFTAAIAAATIPPVKRISEAHAEFDKVTENYTEITASFPHAPKLMYLIFDHSGTPSTKTPLVHLPAYVQAYKGGWLGFHFAGWGTSPLRYRDDGGADAMVPPPTPTRWEWQPELFNINKHGRFFDWFLIRSDKSRPEIFAEDPSIQLVTHGGKWWLYRRLSR